MRKEKIPHQAPFAIQAAQLLGRAIGAGLFAITPAGERGCAARRLSWVTPGFSQSRRCKTTASAKLACLQVDSRGSPQQAFGATELMRLADPSGKLAHAEIKIGNSLIMLSDEFPEMNQRSAQSIGGTPVSMMLYVEEVDALFRQAIAAGATEVRPVENQFYGDRAGTLADPFGHVWTISSHVEDVSMEEINARFSAMVGAG
jgi:Uncharacterized protein conserved in bacteria